MAGDRRIAWLALLLLVGGLLLPFATLLLPVGPAGVRHRDEVGPYFKISFWCVVLALALGVVGRRHLPGKIAGIGAGAIVGIILLLLLATGRD